MLTNRASIENNYISLVNINDWFMTRVF